MALHEAPQVIVMNDTSGRSHHGCTRVMRLLLAGLARHGLNVVRRSPAHHDWTRDDDFIKSLASSDLVVINGEGTLHHGRPAGDRLLSVLDHPARGNTPVAVINSIWQENPATWAERLARCALIATRDEQSRREVAAMGIPVRLVPDLSLSTLPETISRPRDRLIVGDSVSHSTRRALALAARRLRAQMLVPTKTRHSIPWQYWPTRPLLSALYYGASPCGLPSLHLAQNEVEYLALLGRARLHLTGRFHAICLSLVTTTPVLAVGSNSWKIEALLAEAGLAPDRLLPVEQLATLSSDDLNRPYSPSETAGVARYLAMAQYKAEVLFTDLANLARNGRV